ncbi:glycoside hydrolase family 9 protein [Glycomyces xiaoerkulensis]|uniref:glycoside hydrolase family 9 protein n=1 Tax=Glycomyces xiaoerkulensis TaxID=2038139 RepID=UPI0018E4BB15|nr:glycoside hydrolase family 9 protein [Glycomyces xiaoerkulensis]
MLATATAGALALSTVAVANAWAQEEEPTDVLVNGDFATGSADPWWHTDNLSGEVADGQWCIDVPGDTTNAWDAIVGQNDLELVSGETYELRFTASATVETSVRTLVQRDVDPWPTQLEESPVLTPEGETFSYTFTSDADWTDAQLAFQIGGTDEPWQLCISDAALLTGAEPPPDGGEQTNVVVNGDFATGSADPWWHTDNLSGEVADGQWCIDVPGGTTNAWDAIVGQNDLPLTEGESYELRFTASASEPLSVRTLVQRDVDPWPTQLEEFPALDVEPQTYSYTFTSGDDWTDAQLAFQIGRNEDPWQFCISEVALLTGAEAPSYDPDTGPRVRVNQVGYLPDGPKRATVVTDAAEPVAWELADAGGSVVAEGDTEVHGADANSGESVHTIDFSAVTAAGEGFTLTADGETSYPFDIGGDVYTDMATDAMSFYYTQRSGIAIDDEIAPGYGREAGHVDVEPNQGDGDVPCYPGTCDYSLDVTGGWYDAGDHGKYVVNGGISVAQIMGVYERALHAPTGDPDRLADGSLRIPEHGDGVPDVLDEARWEMEFLMKMQVPEGEELAGMAHHKMSDENWTGLPLMPADDSQPRYLGPPSTAATLNLSGTAAQCARLYAPYDADFADQCLTVAETAWEAAEANPDMLAQGGIPAGSGGYGDSRLEDEFYWAAAELFITTGDQAYEDYILGSELHTADLFGAGSFAWADMGPLGRLQLASVPNSLSDRDRVVDSVVSGAEEVLALQEANPWDLTYGNDGYFAWGSNNLVLNNAVVLGVAFDLTGEVRFRDGVLAGLDYILGRNALNNSYVTGYGSHYSENQHSRWYANQLDPSLPNPPDGTLAGGPNTETGTWDPVAQRWLEDCDPQWCYIDDIGSWATNELTINWNSPLSWVANFAADQTATVGDSSCEVDYALHGSWEGGYNAEVVVRNSGDEPLEDLTVRWAMPAGQTADYSWSAELVQEGHIMTATELGGGYPLDPGREYTFGYNGSTADGKAALKPASVSCTTG